MYKSFNIEKRKLNKIWNDSFINESKISNISKINIKEVLNSSIKNHFVFQINTVPIYYNLYKFTGITFTTEEENAVPSELYEERTPGKFHLIYPAFGVAFNEDDDPNESLGGEWDFQVTVAVIKSEIIFSNISENFINTSKVITTISTLGEGELEIPSLQVLINPVDEIFAEYNNFHKWIKIENGYKFQYFAFYPIEEIDVKLNSKLYLFHPGESNAIPNFKIQN